MFDPEKYVQWINKWLNGDLTLFYIGKVGPHHHFSFTCKANAISCSVDKVIYFNDDDVFIDVSNIEKVRREILKHMTEMPDDDFSISCAILTVGLILCS